jgi:CubicO group peptidase (beta-lactamase class C family)
MDSAIRAGEFKKIGSVLVARHGKVVFEDYFDGDVGTLRDTRSATKSITDMLVGIALGEKKLGSVDGRVLALLPERARKMQNPDPRNGKITLEDFLTMSSPLACDDWNDASRGNEERMYLVEDWAQFILDLPVRGRMHVGEQAVPPKYGRYFSYCTGGVFTLSEVLQKATGERTDRYAQEKLFGPLGISDDQPRSPEDRRTLPQWRPLAGNQSRRRSVGEGVYSASRADRRRYGIRLPLVVEGVQVGWKKLSCVLHERQWRE